MDTRSKMIENDEDESDENNKNVENAKLMENAIDGGGGRDYPHDGYY